VTNLEPDRAGQQSLPCHLTPHLGVRPIGYLGISWDIIGYQWI
jgi:hypothetical protein